MCHFDNSSTSLYHVETLAIFIILVLSTQCGWLGRLGGETRVQELWNKPTQWHNMRKQRFFIMPIFDKILAMLAFIFEHPALD